MNEPPAIILDGATTKDNLISCTAPVGAGAVHFAGEFSDNSKSTKVFAAFASVQ